jgi:protein-S-isoprenylcysteine O-methyltransferase Ste14
MFVRKLILAVVWNLALYGGLLFGTAGTFRWWRAWVFVGIVFVSTIAFMLFVFRDRQDLLRERMKGLVQKGQPTFDRVLVLAAVAAFMGTIAFIGLDVFHYRLLPRPPIWVSSLGLVVLLVGQWIVALVFRENAFATSVVRHQAERQHKVVDTGVYSVVRHPMYAGVFLFNVGTALWLESYAAAILTLVPAALLAVRIVYEERFLRRELAGYEEYTERVRYRLVPWVW